MTGVPHIDGVTDLVEIGRGGFGVVYRGTEVEFGRDVAVKVLLPTLDERSRKRFARERRAMGAVSNHPNIVTVYRGGVTETEQPYLIMEYVAGGSLSDRLANHGPVDWRAAALIGATLADALAEAHRAGILHRDVKPANIFQTPAGEPKLGDFGIARLDDGNDTRTGSITASIAHAAPEIIDGQRGDERSDIYSLASTVYALTTGWAPFSRDADQSLSGLLSRITNDDVPKLNLEHAADSFEATVRRALSKQPDYRHPTMVQFAADLRHAATMHASPQPTPAQAHVQPISIPPEPSRPSNRGQLIALGVLALAIAVFGGWAVARAVFGTDSVDTVQASATPTPIVGAEPTAVPTSIPTPTADQTPAPTPRPRPTQAPAATVPPTAIPAPTSVGGGERGSGLGAATEGFTRVSDFSGTITVEVPDAWTSEIYDSRDLPDVDLGAPTRILTVGGSLQALSGDADIRDLSVSGIYVFAARLGGTVEPAGLLDGSLEFWADCQQGARSQILLPDGNAHFQILACARPDGETGVVALTLVPDADQEVGVSVFLQFADIDDLDSLETLVSTLRIDPTRLTADEG